MTKEMRVGERVKLSGKVTVRSPETNQSWSLQGYDFSPTALAIIVPTNHDVMNELQTFFQPGNSVEVEHEAFGTEKAILHRVFTHRGDNTKWVLSFVRAVNINT